MNIYKILFSLGILSILALTACALPLGIHYTDNDYIMHGIGERSSLFQSHRFTYSSLPGENKPVFECMTSMPTLDASTSRALPLTFHAQSCPTLDDEIHWPGSFQKSWSSVAKDFGRMLDGIIEDHIDYESEIDVILKFIPDGAAHSQQERIQSDPRGYKLSFYFHGPTEDSHGNESEEMMIYALSKTAHELIHFFELAGMTDLFSRYTDEEYAATAVQGCMDLALSAQGKQFSIPADSGLRNELAHQYRALNGDIAKMEGSPQLQQLLQRLFQLSLSEHFESEVINVDKLLRFCRSEFLPNTFEHRWRSLNDS